MSASQFSLVFVYVFILQSSTIWNTTKLSTPQLQRRTSHTIVDHPVEHHDKRDVSRVLALDGIAIVPRLLRGQQVAHDFA
jgi:hypothetical protein